VCVFVCTQVSAYFFYFLFLNRTDHILVKVGTVGPIANNG